MNYATSRPLLWAATVCLLAAFCVPMYATSGAAFTTNSTGTQVNGNIYNDKSDVYFNGGPQNANCSAAGLTDGNYYFQVTNPSGSMLLSSDPVANRLVTVQGGVIVSYTSDGTDTPHVTGVGPCDSVSVQLLPYADTDNPGGEYKAWLTPVSSYDPSNAGVCNGGVCYGFPSSSSKTDNFKIRSTPTQPDITGFKWYDANMNGIYEPNLGEEKIPGWKITIASTPINGFTFTDSFGDYSFLVNPNVTYTIGELFPDPDWHPTTPTSGTVAVGSSGDFAGPNFGNVCVGPNSGALTIGYWANHPETASDMTLLNSLTLVNLKGQKVTPFASVAAFQSWLLNASAKNMAYMLSAQLAGMELNANHGLVSASQIVYAPGTNSGGALGFTTIGALMNEAEASIIANPLTTTSGSTRNYQQALKNALDNANNDLNFVEPTLEDCPFTTPY